MDAEEHVRHVPGESAATIAAAAAAPPGTDLRRFYAFQVINDFSFTAGIWIIFLQSRGFSLAEIGLAESAFHLAPITLELPSGSLADVLGRKWSMAAGALLMAGSTALMFVADSLWLLLPALYLNGAAYAFRSGSQQAFLFDSLDDEPAGTRFTSLLGRLNSVSYVAIAATTAIGASLAERDYALPFGLGAGAGLAAAFLAAGLKEPQRPAVGRGMGGTIAEALRIVRGNRQLLALIVFAATLWTVSALVHLYAQAVLAERGLAPSQIGFVLGATLFTTAIGAWLSGRLASLRPFRFWTVAATGVIAGSGLLMGGAPVPVAVLGLIIAELFAGAFEPMIAQRVNMAITSPQRATILSVEGFLYSVTMIWAFPLFGWTAERYGWLPAYGVAGGVVVVLLGAFLVLGGGRPMGPGRR
ncbi:MAG TPA: MFS transporter [Thermomicrobiales bacterium]|nr:MFS transporter [Thermomicrobiales bacterium]